MGFQFVQNLTLKHVEWSKHVFSNRYLMNNNSLGVQRSAPVSPANLLLSLVRLIWAVDRLQDTGQTLLLYNVSMFWVVMNELLLYVICQSATFDSEQAFPEYWIIQLETIFVKCFKVINHIKLKSCSRWSELAPQWAPTMNVVKLRHRNIWFWQPYCVVT